MRNHSRPIALRGGQSKAYPNPAIRLPWPKNAASGIGSNQGITSGSLPFRCCNGDCSYESLWWEPCVPEERAEGERAGKLTETAFRPYDLAVNAFLLIAKHHLGSELSVSTDREGAQWKDASELSKRELGYSAEAKIELGLLLLNSQAPLLKPAPLLKLARHHAADLSHRTCPRLGRAR